MRLVVDAGVTVKALGWPSLTGIDGFWVSMRGRASATCKGLPISMITVSSLRLVGQVSRARRAARLVHHDIGRMIG